MKPYQTGVKVLFQNDFPVKLRVELGRQLAELGRKTVALYQSYASQAAPPDSNSHEDTFARILPHKER